MRLIHDSVLPRAACPESTIADAVHPLAAMVSAEALGRRYIPPFSAMTSSNCLCSAAPVASSRSSLEKGSDVCLRIGMLSRVCDGEPGLTITFVLGEA